MTIDYKELEKIEGIKELPYLNECSGLLDYCAKSHYKEWAAKEYYYQNKGVTRFGNPLLDPDMPYTLYHKLIDNGFLEMSEKVFI